MSPPPIIRDRNMRSLPWLGSRAISGSITSCKQASFGQAWHFQHGRSMNLKRSDLVTVIAVMSVSLPLGLPATRTLRRNRATVARLHRLDHQKRIGLAFHMWATDHGGVYPMHAGSKGGTIREGCASRSPPCSLNLPPPDSPLLRTTCRGTIVRRLFVVHPVTSTVASDSRHRAISDTQ